MAVCRTVRYIRQGFLRALGLSAKLWAFLRYDPFRSDMLQNGYSSVNF